MSTDDPCNPGIPPSEILMLYMRLPNCHGSGSMEVRFGGGEACVPKRVGVRVNGLRPENARVLESKAANLGLFLTGFVPLSELDNSYEVANQRLITFQFSSTAQDGAHTAYLTFSFPQPSSTSSQSTTLDIRSA